MNHLPFTVFAFALCTAAALTDAADMREDVRSTSPDERFALRYFIAKDEEVGEWETPHPSEIDIVELASKRVVLRTPKDGLKPMRFREQGADWSRDSKRVALNYQTGPRTWTCGLYGWDGEEFAELAWPREAIRKQLEQKQAEQLKTLGLPENTARKPVHESFTAEGWDDPDTVRLVAEAICSVVLAQDTPPAELDVRFRYTLKIHDPQRIEIASVEKIDRADFDDPEARLADEQPESFYLVKDVADGGQPFRLYALERFAVVDEEENDYLVEDRIGEGRRGRIPRRLVHKFPFPFSGAEAAMCASRNGIHYRSLLKAARSGHLPALRAMFALQFDGALAEVHYGYAGDLPKFVSANLVSKALESFPAARVKELRDYGVKSESAPKAAPGRRREVAGFSQILAKSDSCARLVNEDLAGYTLVTRVPAGRKPFQVYGGEYFAITGEKEGEFLIEDAAGNQGYVAKDFVDKIPKPATESAMLLPLMGIHYLRVVKETQNEGGWEDTRRLMLSLDLTGASGAQHARNLEAMHGGDEVLAESLEDFSLSRVKAIRAMMLHGRSEKEKAELMKRYPMTFRNHAR